MTSQDFVFWLNGFLEIANPTHINEKETQIIKDHIALVLKKETPDRNILKQVEPKDPSKSLQEVVEELLQRKQETIPPHNPTINPLLNPINPLLNPLTPGLPLIPTYPPYTITCSGSASAVSPSDIATSAQCTTVDPVTGITTSVEQKFDPNKPIFIC